MLKTRKVRVYREIECKYCKNKFSTHREAKYCSTACCNRDRLLGKGEIQPKPCIVCGKTYKPQKRTTRFCSNACSSQWKSQDPAYIENLKAGCLKRSDDPAYIEKLSKKALERWNNPDFREKMEGIYTSDEFAQKSNESYLVKDYVFPSGKTVRVQGYEPQALDKLLESYNEDDILVGKDIRECTGQIVYTDENGNLRRYNPDIYIRSERKIVEVKSDWTYNVNFEQNQRKKQACEDLGYQFVFMIL